MGCNCNGNNDYELSLDSTSGSESTTPEYTIILDGTGTNGFSPAVNFINQTTNSFQIQVQDIEGIKTSGVIPLIDSIGNGTITITQGGVTKGTFTTNQSGNTTIELDAGGSSVTNPITLSQEHDGMITEMSFGLDGNGNWYWSNPWTIRSGGSTIQVPFIPPNYTTVKANGGLTNTTSSNLGIEINQLSVAIDDTTIKINQDGELYAVGGGGGSYTAGTGIDITGDVISVDNTVAMKTDIPTVNNSTITFTQGGTTKGTITLNQSSNQTIEFDAGGGGAAYTAGAGIDITNNEISLSQTLGGYIENYTAVGNPTIDITNGTAEFNSNSQYLLTTPIQSDASDTSLKLVMCFKLNSISGENQGLFDYNGTAGFRFTIAYGYPRIRYTTDAGSSYLFDITGTTLLSTNTKYWLTVTMDSTGVKLYSSTDGVTQTLEGSNNYNTFITDSLQYKVGDNHIGLSLNGTVYLDECYYLRNEVKVWEPITYSTGNAAIATNNLYGVVKPDGSTITINNGIISTASDFVRNLTTGTGSVNIETGALRTNNYAITMGNGANSYDQGVAIGYGTTALNGVAIGYNAGGSSGNSIVAIGNNAQAVRRQTVVVGHDAYAINQESVVIGYNAKAGSSSYTSYGSVSIGCNAGSTNHGTTSIGYNAQASGDYSMAVGCYGDYSTQASGTLSIALGSSARASATRAIQIGYGSNSTANSLQVGSYQLLDTSTGLIPDARINNNIARTTDLTNKADTDLSNVTDTGYIKMAGASMPSGTYISLTLGASGTNYTMPADGFFIVSKRGQSAGDWLVLSSQNGLRVISVASTAGAERCVILPVAKNNTVLLTYSNQGEDMMCRFVYAVGSESEAS